MKTDKERLDWMEGQTGLELKSFGTYWKLLPSNEKPFRQNSLRDVIDEAMEYEKPAVSEEDPTCGGMLSECEQCGRMGWSYLSCLWAKGDLN